MADNKTITARQPRGFEDASGAKLKARRAMLEKIRAVYERFGFEPLETPAVEYVEALGKFLPEQDRPDEGIFAFADTDKQWLALRYDLTAPLSRYVAQMGQNLTLPFRRYQVGPVWRNEKPGPGHYREFLQFDVDTVGSASPAADAENAAVVIAALEALGLKRGEYIIKISNRKLLDGVLEKIGLSAGDSKALAVLRAIDKLDRFGLDGVKLLLTTGRKDESGDFTKGAGLPAKDADAVLAFTQSGKGTRSATLAALAGAVAGSAAGEAGLKELADIDAVLRALGIGDDRATFDPGIVRGLAYYTGPVLEAVVTAEVTGEDGRKRQLGSVAGGGRYDNLVSRFTGAQIPATGVSIGVDRLLATLTLLGRMQDVDARGPVLVAVFDQARIAEYEKIAAELRAAGISAEVFLGQGGLKAQLRYADRRNAPVAVIAGEDEFKAGTVSLKDLAKGEEMAKAISSNVEWREKSRAQVSVPRAELVARVKAMLG